VDTTGTLQTISGSLTNTSGSLTGTTGVLRTILASLRDTSGVLVTVNGRVKTINQVLHAAESAQSQGVGAVPALVSGINADDAVSGILSDTHKINSGLTDAENHLTSICKSAVATLLVTETKC
jgi:hypothetical protein